jgi:hypothetical protein
MSNEKQTAVEWFMEKIGEKQPNGLYVIDTLHDVQNLYQQAKEMEKEQMIELAREVLMEAYATVEGNVTTELTIQEYYNLKYGK